MPLSRSLGAVLALVCLAVVGSDASWLIEDKTPTSVKSNFPFVVVRVYNNTAVNPDNQDTYVNAWMEVIGTENGNNEIQLPYGPANTTELYKIGIHVRGQTTRGEPKKPFAVKMYDPDFAEPTKKKVSLLGFGEQDRYDLYASGADPSRIRNQLTFNLYASMGHFAPRMQYVELFIAQTNTSQVTYDDYRGVYMLSETIHRGSQWVDIHKMKQGDDKGKSVTGGYIFKIDKWDSGAFDNSTVIYTNCTHYIIIEPKTDVLDKYMYAYLEDDIEQMESAILSKSGYTDLVDLGSFVDMFIIQELAKNNDAYRLSQYFYKDKEGKVVSGPVWDMDRTYGNEMWKKELAGTSGWIYDTTNVPEVTDNIPRYWQSLLADPVFIAALQARWIQLRDGALSTSNILSLVDQYHDALNAQGASDRDYKLWGPWWFAFDIFFHGNYNDYTTDKLKEWIPPRLEWMDATIAAM